ncbi:MAG: hypothetical protein ACO36E_10425, partial [Synechocystis sp.]
QDVVQEALAILGQNLPLSKMAALLSRWQSEQGDYLQLRERLFAEETVDSLGKKILAFEGKSSQESSLPKLPKCP